MQSLLSWIRWNAAHYVAIATAHYVTIATKLIIVKPHMQLCYGDQPIIQLYPSFILELNQLFHSILPL